MALSDKGLSEMLKEMYQPMMRQHLEAPPSLRFDKFQTQKKEEPKVSYNIDLVLSAEGLAKFIVDNQELSTPTKYMRDERGNRVMGDDGNYKMVEVPLAERWIGLGDVKWNGEKFVIRTNIDVLSNMEALNARKARIAEYQSK